MFAELIRNFIISRTSEQESSLLTCISSATVAENSWSEFEKGASKTSVCSGVVAPSRKRILKNVTDDELVELLFSLTDRQRKIAIHILNNQLIVPGIDISNMFYRS
jgi:hypothetical protein